MTSRFHTGPDGKTRYITSDGDTVDHIAWKFYGRHQGTTELILEANRGLANRGLVLPAGVEIILPEAPPPKPKPLITLWS